MKFTLSWLKEHLETGATLDQILEKLNAIGLEVEGVENPAEKLAPFRIARVLSAAPHPQADKLQILSVDAGEGPRSEEHTSELQSLMRNSYAVFCLKNKKHNILIYINK